MIEDLQHVTALLDRIDQKLGKHGAPPNNSSSANFNINGGGWINAIALVLMGGLALAMFIMYLSDRDASAREREDFRQQARVDVQRLEKANQDLNGKLETQQAYINEIYRSLKTK